MKTDNKVTLRPVTSDGLEELFALKVHEYQKGFVSTVAESLAQAYVYRDTAYPFAVYEGEKIVGFIMMGYYEAKRYYTLWKLLIGKGYQHRGIGRQALVLGIEFLRERFGEVDIYTGVIPENTAAKELYTSLGFEPTGLFENGMEEMRLKG